MPNLSPEIKTLAQKYRQDKTSLSDDELYTLLSGLDRKYGKRHSGEPSSIDPSIYRKAYNDTWWQAFRTGVLDTITFGALGEQDNKATDQLREKHFQRSDINSLSPSFKNTLEKSWHDAHDAGNLFTRVGVGVAIPVSRLAQLGSAANIAITTAANTLVEGAMPALRSQVDRYEEMDLPRGVTPEMMGRAENAGFAAVFTALPMGGLAWIGNRLARKVAASKEAASNLRVAAWDDIFNRQKVYHNINNHMESAPASIMLDKEGNFKLPNYRADKSAKIEEDVFEITRWMDSDEGRQLLMDGDPEHIELIKLLDDATDDSHPVKAKIQELHILGRSSEEAIDKAAENLYKRMRKVYTNLDDEQLMDMATLARAAAVGGRSKNLDPVTFLDGLKFTDEMVDLTDDYLFQSRPPGDLMSELKESGMVPSGHIAAVLGDERPEYLDNVIKYLVDKRNQVSKGGISVRDIAKAYTMTVASQRSGARNIEKVFAAMHEVGEQFDLPREFMVGMKSGKLGVRPEDLTGAWFLSKNGQKALDELECGVFNDELWDKFRELRKRIYGIDTINNSGMLNPAGKNKYTMQNLVRFAEELNKTAPDMNKMNMLVERLNGVSTAKTGFLKHLLGFGDTPTIDAVEVSWWITGKADPRMANSRLLKLTQDIKPKMDQKTLVKWLRNGVSKRFSQLNKTMGDMGIPDEHYQHVMRRWLWDRAQQTETTHASMYKAMMLAQDDSNIANELKGAIKLNKDGSAMVHALKGHDTSTAIHEFWHYLTAHVTNADKAILENALNISNGLWKSVHYERVARWGELYMREGKAPTEELKGVFQRMRHWMKQIYKNLRGSPLEKKMSKEVKDVFDRLLTPEDTDAGVRAALNFREKKLLQTTGGNPGITERVVPLGKRNKGFINWIKRYALDSKGRQDYDRAFRRAMVDRMEAVEAMEYALTQQREGKVYRDARLLPRVTGRVRHYLTDIMGSPAEIGYHDEATGKWISKGKGLEQIINPLIKGKGGSFRKLQDFMDYALAKRTLEVTGRVVKKKSRFNGKAYKTTIETGIDVNDAAVAINSLESKYPEFPEKLKELVNFEHFFLDELLRAQIITQESHDRMVARGAFYIPLKRFFDESSEGGRELRRNISKPIQELKGSDRLIMHPLLSIIENAYTMTMAAARNKVFLKMAEMAEASPEGSVWMQKMSDYVNRDWADSVDEVREVLKKNQRRVKGDPDSGFALTNIDKLSDDEVIQYASIMKPLQGSNSNVITVFKNGKPVPYRVDPTIAEAFNSGDITAGNILVHSLEKAFSKAASLKRLTATQLNPEFPLFNLVRDQFAAAIYSKYGSVFKVPFVDIPRSLSRMARGSDEAWLEYIRMGGTNASLASLDADITRQSLRKIGSSGMKDIMTGVLNPYKIVDVMRNANDYAEVLTRYQEFGRGFKGAKSYDDLLNAMYDSQEITLDFYRAGTVGQKLNRWSAFWNAWMQGNSRFYRAIKGKNQAKVMTRMIGMLTLPSIAMQYGILKNEKVKRSYLNRPDWERTIFWHIPLPQDFTEATGDPSGEVRFLKIPKPQGAFMLFTAPAEAYMQWASTHDPTLIDGIGRQLAIDIMFEKVKNPVPDLVLPALEVYTNYDIFRQMPIESYWDKQRLSEYRYGQNTSEFAMAAGQTLPMRVLDLSPKEIDHVIHGYFTGIGRLGLDAVDKIATLLGRRIAEPKKWTPEEIPVARRFVSREPGMSGRVVGEFYDDLGKALGAYKQLQEFTNDNDIERFIKRHETSMFGRNGFVSRNSPRTVSGAFVARYSKMNDIQSRLKMLRNQRNAIVENEHASPERKAELIASINRNAIDLVNAYRMWEQRYFKRFLK